MAQAHRRITSVKRTLSRACACAVSLALVCCCNTGGLAIAYADDAASGEAAATTTTPTTEGSGDSTPSPSTETAQTPTETEQPSTQTTTDGAGDTGADSGAGASESGAAAGSSGAATSPSTTPSGAITPAAPTNSGSAASTDPQAGDENNDGEEEKKEESADDMRARAEIALEQAAALQPSIDELRAQYDAAKQKFDEANALKDETQAQLDHESAGLEVLKAEMSDYVVDMYKQGGIAPYLDVLLGATSYREFLTSWYMTNEVPRYGRDAIRERNEELSEFRNTIATCEEQAKQAEEEMKNVEVKKRQAEVNQLALLAHAASLNLGVATMEGDEAAIASATSAFEQAQATLQDAIKQGGVGGENVLFGDGVFNHPCPGARYSSGFGYRSFDNSFHKGLDMAISEGAPYYAAESGTVIGATNGGGYNGGAGNWVVIDHGNGLVTKYMHSLVTLVNVGDHVERGQTIGLVGNTGNSFGAHLHFQVEVNGVAVNPLTYL